MAAGAVALETIGTPEARAAVDRRAEGADLAEVSRDYGRYITDGDEGRIPILVLALARYCGDGDKMVNDYHWCGNAALEKAADVCDYALMQRTGFQGVVSGENPNPASPKWPGATQPADE
jgi:hypothetical protein